jgi:hypothetical protein
VDGADNVDRGSNQTLLTYPSVDAIAEFKTLRGNFSAEFGRSASGQINVITKSGTSKFHGDAYEFFRNDVLNANTVLNKRANPIIKRAPLRYNDFGYTIGGPAYIPHVYNTDKSKTFFFFSQEYRRVVTYGNVSGAVPTAQERLGIFPVTVCTQVSAAGTCTATGTQITNINPIAQQYLKDVYSKIPLPNDPSDPTGHNLISSLRNVFNDRQDLVRIDQNFGTKVNAFYRYIHDTLPTIEPGGLFTGSPLPGVANTSTTSPGTSHMGHATIAFTPTLLADVGYSFSYGAIISRPTGLISSANSPDVQPTLAFQSSLARIPSVSLVGGPTASVTSFGPYNDFNRDHNAFGNLTKVFGSHSLRGGVSYHHYQKTENNGGNNAGTFAFDTTGAPTGFNSKFNISQSFANFLSGFVTTFSQASLDLTPNVQTNQFEAYLQDEWRMRPNLTLSYGARYSYFQQPYDANNLLTNFDPALFDPAKAPTIDSAGNICTVAPCAGGGTPNPNYDPLNGIIINGKNSPFGKQVGSTPTGNIAPRVGIAWDPYGRGKTSIRAGYGWAYDATLFGIYEQNTFQNPPFVQSIAIDRTSFSNPLAGTVRTSPAPLALHATPADYKTPYTQEYTLDVQHELVRNLIFDVGYFGSKGTHLLVIEDINQPLPNAFRSVFPTAPALTSANEGQFINAVRPYRGYSAINALETVATSNYNGLQSAMRWQFTGTSQIGAAYTWSKCLTNSRTDRSNAPQSFYNLAGEYGLCQFDRRNVFSLNYVYAVPFFKNSNAFLKYTLGGWEVAGILAFNSGLPLSPTTSQNLDPAGQGLKVSTSNAALRPNQVGDPNTNAPHSIAQWFNTSAFANLPNSQTTPGTSHPSAITGPGFERIDFSLFKNIPIHESISMQFRAEAFNVLNHTNYDTVNTNISQAQYGQVTGFRDPRIMQLALKFYF